MKKYLILGLILFTYKSNAGLRPIPSNLETCMRGLEKVLAVEVFFQNPSVKNEEDRIVVVPQSGTNGDGTSTFDTEKSGRLTDLNIYTSAGLVGLSNNQCSLKQSTQHTSALDYLDDVFEYKRRDLDSETISKLSACESIETENKSLLSLKNKVKSILNDKKKIKVNGGSKSR